MSAQFIITSSRLDARITGIVYRGALGLARTPRSAMVELSSENQIHWVS